MGALCMQSKGEEFLWGKLKDKQNIIIFHATQANWIGNGNAEGKEIVKVWASFYQSYNVICFKRIPWRSVQGIQVKELIYSIFQK